MRQIIGLIIIVLTVVGCKKEEQPKTISYSLTADFRVPANLQIAQQHHLDAVSALNPTDSVLSANGLSSDQVNSIVIDTLYITKTDTFGATLNFLRELEILLEGGTEAKMLIGTSGELPEVLPDSIGLNATTRSLHAFLSGDSVLLWPSVLTDQSVLAATDLEVVIDLTLTAK